MHKWLITPLGAALLYVKKDKINKLWPLFAEVELPRDDIDRLNHTGTTPVHVELTISNSDLINNKYLLIQKGKKNYYIIKVV